MGRSGFTHSIRPGNARKYTKAFIHELCVMPPDSTWEEAATLPMASLTAFQGLFSHGPFKVMTSTDDRYPEENEEISILITGASSRAGMWAVQLAKAAGAGRITATCKAADTKLMRRLGADPVLDCDSNSGNLESWTGRKFKAVYDFVGGVTLERA